VYYKGTSWLNKKEFDKNFGDATGFPVTVGAGGVIKGWDEGLVGAKEGGRRQLIIPPEMAYGSSAQGDKIAANDTLVFVIDIVKVTKASGSTAGEAGTQTTLAPTTLAPTTLAPTTIKK
jgi:peptidylprolyl isomerase